MPLSTLHQPGAQDPFFTEPFEEGFSFMEGNGGVLCGLKGRSNSFRVLFLRVLGDFFLDSILPLCFPAFLQPFGVFGFGGFWLCWRFGFLLPVAFW